MNSKFMLKNQLDNLAKVTGRRIIVAVSATLVSSLMAGTVLAAAGDGGAANPPGKPTTQSRALNGHEGSSAKDNVTASHNNLAPAGRIDGRAAALPGVNANRDSGKKDRDTATPAGSRDSTPSSANPSKQGNPTRGNAASTAPVGNKMTAKMPAASTSLPAETNFSASNINADGTAATITLGNTKLSQ